ncbi:MAG: Enterococcus phage, partial [Bacteroidota bacterium]
MKWVPIKGYEGLYEVSSAGEIKSLNRETLHPKGGKKILNEKILTGSFDKDGYVIESELENGKA